MDSSPRRLVNITLWVSPGDQSGLTLDVSVSAPEPGYDGGDVLLALACGSTHVAAACDAAWAHMVAGN